MNWKWEQEEISFKKLTRPAKNLAGPMVPD